MRKTDISNYKEKETKKKPTGNVGPVKTILNAAVKVLLTVLLVCFVAGVIVCFNVLIYLAGLASQPSGIDLDARSLNLSSFVYVQNPETEEFEEYQILYGSENREWVEYDQMPTHLFDAIIAIEDKRFYEHHGVDWRRTGSAVLNLALKGDDSYGGSTITQQLIKNLTQDDEASINRKVREIIKALKVEQEYSKDEILEAYLNVVNFGGSCQGVQAAANRYFDKNLGECAVAECAAMVGITQNPSAWDPFIYPDNNKYRREDQVLWAMHDQGKLTDEEYDAALEESANMEFADPSEGNVDINIGDVQNWYQDELVYDLAADLAEYYNISEDAAIDKLYTEGYKIYSAMDVEAQKIIEEEAINIDKSSDPDLQIGMSLIGPDGRVIATAGSSIKKDANLIHNRATMSFLQPGSSIKPVVAYPYALERNLINYSSYIKDEPLESWVYDDGSNGPYNWYDTKHKHGLMTFDAIEWSSNCCAAQCIEMIGGPEVAHDHATSCLGLNHLNDEDRYSIASLSLGGMNGGVSVREMASAYTYLINGGMHYEPYTYYYVTDSRDNIILDNREPSGVQAYSKDTATIMNRLLNYNVENCAHTPAWQAAVYGWEICGKTGTTNDDYDSWFCGVSPYAALAVWTGFDDPAEIYDTSVATATFSNVMGRYLEDKEYKDYDLSEGVVEEEYCTITGKLAEKTCKSKATGYYTEDNMPSKCKSHAGFVEDNKKPTNDAEYDKPTETTEATIGIEIVIPTEGETVPTTTDPVEANGN